jgi:hypothetical protein
LYQNRDSVKMKIGVDIRTVETFSNPADAPTVVKSVEVIRRDFPSRKIPRAHDPELAR